MSKKTAWIIISIMITLSGCSEKTFSEVYEKAKDKAVEISFSTDGLQGIADDLGLMSPEEILAEAHRLLSVHPDAAEYSNSAEKGDEGEILAKTVSEGSKTANSSDRSVYEHARAEHGDGDVLTKASLIRVVDGDTLVVCLEGSCSYIRLIGINAEESVAPAEYLEKSGKENTKEGLDASAHLKELTAGHDECWLEFDEDLYDTYDRILAYVWISQDRTDLSNMLNARMVMDGHAQVMTVRPNVRYAEEFIALSDDGK